MTILGQPIVLKVIFYNLWQIKAIKGYHNRKFENDLKVQETKGM